MSGQDGPGHRPGTRVATARFARVLTIRLGPGEDVLPAMGVLMDEHEIRHAVILGGVASLHHLTVRNIHRFPEQWPITENDRRVTTVPGPLEVLGMQGNVARRRDGGLVIHCHLDVSMGSPPAVTYGGHLVEDTIVATTCELYLAELAGDDVYRVRDDVTMADELHVDAPAADERDATG